MLQRVYAQISGTVERPPTGEDWTLPRIFGIAINLVLGAGIGISIIFLILGGIQYVMSKGDAKAAETARKWLTNAVIGMVIVVGVFALRTLVFTALGFGAFDTVQNVVELGGGGGGAW